MCRTIASTFWILFMHVWILNSQEIDEDVYPAVSRAKRRVPHPPDARRHHSNTSSLADSGLFPVVFNLASGADISSNATCGNRGPEQFCKLVQHQITESNLKAHCGICDSGSSDPLERHPIQNAIDGSQRWWQSPSIAEGKKYNWVTVTIDLKQVYQVAYVIMKAANSPRPGNWVLERSLDGEDYKPWQFFAISDSECWNSYGIPPTVGVPKYKSDDEVICTSYYSRLDPLMNGEIHVSLVNGRPGVKGPSDMLLDFTTTRYVRLRLQRIRTLNADLMTFIYNAPKDLDASVSNRYFYSIKDISIGGQCICYGHAKHCPSDPVTGELNCECEGNTCGKSCEICCPLYNQYPWQQGTYEESAMCQECECFNHALECVYNETMAEQGLSLNVYGEYDGGGVCVDCQHNTMGVNCELCADGFYRPSNKNHRDPDACGFCDCDTIGSTGLCVKDDSMALEGIYAGDCICLAGYCGPRCDECSPGYRGYPYCEPCPCNKAGSTNLDTCEYQCICKPNVYGEHCDQCLSGHYNLQESNPNGCEECFCLGVSDQCTQSTWGRDRLSALENWLVTDLAGSGVVRPSSDPDGLLTVRAEQLSQLNRAVYWQAPPKFIGDKVAAYGGVLEYVFSYSINTSTLSHGDEQPYLANYDVVLEGSGLRLGHSGEYFHEEMENVIFVNMTETQWVHIDGSTSPEGTLVPREEFIILLARVDRLLIRAAYHVYQTQTRLLNMVMEVASEYAPGPPMSAVETCTCPQGFGGTSCESCAPGYRRVGNILLEGLCEPCQCHGHSRTCDPFTGECLGCQHNTRGAFCEDCAFSYFGDATLGTPEACKPCGCPLELESNNFAEGCVRTPMEETEYICIGCKPGYVGTFCELCENGFYGNPLIPGRHCLPCDCHGNTDPADSSLCDRFSGECYECVNHAEGFNCERCVEGFFGTAVNGDCQECDCNTFGSINTLCNGTSGVCECKARYTGRDCGQCQAGYGNTALGCVQCNCSDVGSTSEMCDAVTGQCPCKSGVGGSSCTACQPGYFDLTLNGCISCQCDVLGSQGLECDVLTGQCDCLPGVTGSRCDHCQADHWGLSSGEGCEPCQCDVTGSEESQCEAETGQCRCKPGVGGLKCSQCLPGYYGISWSGCKECPVCPLPGQVCDPETGDCVCPPNTEGSQCERCKTNTWGYDPYKGCQVCECDRIGSSSQQCDVTTGQCSCVNIYIGRQCDQCPFGQYGFPFCAPCKCDLAGTLPGECDLDQGLCQCDLGGNCPCKSYAEGDKCQRCQPGTFSLSRDHPNGCTACFCFGHAASNQCRQARYLWSQKKILDKKIEINLGDFTDVTKHATGGFLVVPPESTSITVAVGDSNLPVFYSLPRSALGDKTESYNGMLSFTVMRELVDDSSGGFEDMGPVAHLWGNYHYQLFYLGEPTISGDKLTYNIPLHEYGWRDQYGRNVSRETMMVALQDLQYWMIKVADNSADTKQVGVYDLAYDSAVPTVHFDTDALGIEECDCLPEWEGLSCQNPSSGNYRRRPDGEVTDPVDMVGESIPCQCNGHSLQCEKETGICQDCEDFTTGTFCQLCASGFHGNSTHGVCSPCSCPLISQSNNFSPTCVSTDNGDHICDACPEGYIGNRCEKCAERYFGDPTVPGSWCEPCACNLEGSDHSVCDPVTGQCACLSGIIGRTCDRCKPRHAIVEGSCISCEEECPGILMTTIDEMDSMMERFNTSAAALLPWARLSKIDNAVYNYRGLIRGSDIHDYSDLQEELDDLKNTARKALSRAKDVKTISESETVEAIDILEDSEIVSGTISQSQKDLKEITRQLENVAEQQSAAGGLKNLTAALEEAEQIVKLLKEVSFESDAEKMDSENSEGSDLLEKAKKMLEESSPDMEKVKADTADNEARIQELIDTAGDTQIQIEDIADLNTENREKLNDIKSIIDRVKSGSKEISSIHGMGEEDINTAAYLLWNVSSTNYQKSADILRELRMKKEDIEMKMGLIKDGVPSVIPLVRRAQDHAAELEKQANGLEGLFTETKVAAEDPLKAAGVYESIVDAIKEAENATDAATRAALKAFNSIVDSPDGPVGDQVRDSLAASKDLHDDATAHTKKLDEMKPRMEKVREDVRVTEDTDLVVEETLTEINEQMEKFDPELTSNVRETAYQSLATQGKADAMGKRAQEILEEANNDMKPKVEEMRSLKLDGIRKANSSVNAAKGEFSKLFELTTVLDTKKERVDKIGIDIGNSIIKLKEEIRLAREQAKSIKISLYHENDCARRYEKETPEPTTTNNIVLHFKTNHTNQNMLLFLLRTPGQTDYLALEFIDGRVRFLWDAGAGTAMVESDVIIESFQDKNTEKDMWYRVEAQRYGGLGKLNVRKMSAEGTPSFTENVGLLTHSELHVDSQTEVYVGGAPNGLQLPGEVRSHGFSGCIGEAYLDGKPIGLYNFRAKEGKGCGGCLNVPTIEDGSSVYQFDGTGFAAMPQIRYRRDLYTIVLVFKSYWDDAIIFFTNNPDTDDFMSLELENGRVVFRFGFQGEAEARLETVYKYNTNQLVQVKAQRQGRQGKLEVDREIQEGSAPDTVDGSMDLHNRQLNFAGLPATMNTTKYGVTRKGFLGCMQNVQVSSRGTYLQNFLDGYFAGMTTGCKSDRAREVGLPGNGHVELPSDDLPRDGGFAFSFKTQQANGLLLLAKGYKKDNYYSVSLTGGRVSAWFNAGSGATRITSERAYNDGQLHSVSTVKTNRLIDLYVDDLKVGSGRLPSGASRINSMLGSSGGLYIGGVPDDVDASGRAASLISLKGCIRNLVLNGRLLTMDNPVRFTHVDIGRCDLASLFPNMTDVDVGNGTEGGEMVTTQRVVTFTVTVTLPPTPSTTTELALPTTLPGPTVLPTQCASIGPIDEEEGAVAFGDVKHSHAEIIVSSRSINRDFNATLEFRTYYKKGLLFYITNEDQTEYVAVQLDGGRVVLSYDDRGQQKFIKAEENVNDGHWHSLFVKKDRRSITVRVDNSRPHRDQITRRVDVIAPIYVGGLPEVITARSGLVSESLKGCMRSFYLNGRDVDLANSKAIMGVRPCFSHVEPGVHFDGFGSAIYHEQYKIVSDFSVAFDFRTSGMDGVILSTSHMVGYPALALEMYEGKMVFTAVDRDNNRFSAVAAGKCEHCLCDNNWHRVTAEYIRNVVTLRVDDGKNEVAVNPGDRLALNLAYEMHIGGFPSFALPQGATHTDIFFEGCLRSLNMNGTLMDWHKTHSLYDVHVSACPVSIYPTKP